MRHPIALVALALLPMLAGCGGESTPQTTANKFVGYMKNGKFLEAAKLWDYETKARQEASDWDTYGETQRALIINKLAEEKAEAMKLGGTRFTGVKVAEVNETGDTAVARLEGGVKSLELKKVGEEWKITGINY